MFDKIINYEARNVLLNGKKSIVKKANHPYRN